MIVKCIVTNRPVAHVIPGMPENRPSSIQTQSATRALNLSMDAAPVRARYDTPLMREQRQLGLAAAIAVVTGESIALGIFLTPAAMAKSLGSPALLAAVWGGMAIMAMCGALCYSELAVRYPESGGEYVYLRAGYGEQTAFLYGWMSAIVMYPGVAAALAVGSAAYLAQLLPLSPGMLAAAPALLLCGFGLINFLGTRLSAAIMS